MNIIKNEKILKIPFDRRTTLMAGLIILVFYFPVGLFHESGHIAICVNNGSTYQLTFEFPSFKTHCDIVHEPILLYFSIGGIFGMIGASSPFVSKYIRKNKGIRIGLFVLVTSQFVNLVFETWKHEAYINNDPLVQILIMLANILALLFFLNRFARVDRVRT